MAKDIDLTGMVNLAQLSLGAEVLSATDEFFAEKENLLKSEPPVFIDGKFTERGKWMDGWESRRRRAPGHDSCVIRICRGVIHALEISTQHFTGNYPEQVMVEATDCDTDPGDETEWVEILPMSPLEGDARNLFQVESNSNWSHIRLNIYPDGGVARFRAYGKVFRNWDSVPQGESVELTGLANGGLALACSDMHFGSMWNLLGPGRAANMGDGWETARRRGPGHDWAVIQLGRPGKVQKIEVDTLHFKGNYPASCTVRATYSPGVDPKLLTDPDHEWSTLVENSPLYADVNHIFEQNIEDIGVISHVMLEIYPDGGVGRFRVHGEPVSELPETLTAVPLVAEKFKLYGDVIELAGRSSRTINSGYADRYENLTDLDLTDGGEPALSIFRARPIALPFPVKCMERHPRSSQMFMPKGSGRFLVLVAGDSQEPDPANMRLFISNGQQGVNYKRGVWHHFLMALDEEQEFIVVDRSDPDGNTDEVELDPPYPIISSF